MNTELYSHTLIEPLLLFETIHLKRSHTTRVHTQCKLRRVVKDTVGAWFNRKLRFFTGHTDGINGAEVVSDQALSAHTRIKK